MKSPEKHAGGISFLKLLELPQSIQEVIEETGLPRDQVGSPPLDFVEEEAIEPGYKGLPPLDIIEEEGLPEDKGLPPLDIVYE